MNLHLLIIILLSAFVNKAEKLKLYSYNQWEYSKFCFLNWYMNLFYAYRSLNLQITNSLLCILSITFHLYLKATRANKLDYTKDIGLICTVSCVWEYYKYTLPGMVVLRSWIIIAFMEPSCYCFNIFKYFLLMPLVADGIKKMSWYKEAF